MKKLTHKSAVIAIVGACLLTALFFFLYLSPRLNREFLSDEDLDGMTRFVLVFAHADDEVTNAGFIRFITQHGIETTIIALTDGRANENSIPEACKENDMFACRSHELMLSANELGIKHVLTAGFPDSHLDQHVDEAANYVAEQLRKIQPQGLMCMETSGLNRHTDHMAAHVIAMEALSRANLTQTTKVFLSTLPYPINVFLRTKFPSDINVKRRHFLLNEDLISHKIKAAEAHASQMKTIRGLTGGLGPNALFHWMNREAYYVPTQAQLSEYLKEQGYK